MFKMTWLKAAVRECKTHWLQSLHRQPVVVAPRSPLVSISFDDVPLSAFQNGLPLINRYGIKATFYICLGMQDTTRFVGPREVQLLQTDGHEIGCHTYSHYLLTIGSALGMAADAKRNRELLSHLMNGMAPHSFSFPFGELSFAAKRELRMHYSTLRSSRPGVNSGISDFNCLRAVSLESDTYSEALVHSWLDDAVRRTGWLIFFTHGITSNPSRYDLTLQMLESLLATCVGRGFQTLPVEQAARVIRGTG